VENRNLPGWTVVSLLRSTVASLVALGIGCGGGVGDPESAGSIAQAAYDPGCVWKSGTYVLNQSRYDAVDNKPLIQCLLSNPNIRVIQFKQPDGNLPWITSALVVPPSRQNLEIVFDPGVILQARVGAFSGLNAAPLISIHGPASGHIRPTFITIRGASYQNKGRLVFPANIDSPSACLAGTGRHAISIRNADDIVIDQIKIDRTFGDGVYLGDIENLQYMLGSRRVALRNLEINQPARNGISVIAGSDISILNCTITNVTDNGCTGGKAPWSGVHVEPNHTAQTLTNININHTDIDNVQGNGITLELANARSLCCQPVVSALRPRISRAQGSGIRVSNAFEHLQGTIGFTDALITDSQMSAIFVRDKLKEGPSLQFLNLRIERANLSPIADVQNNGVIVFTKETPMAHAYQNHPDGDVQLNQLTVNTGITRPLVWLAGRAPYRVEDVSGTITVEQGSRTIDRVYELNTNIQVLP
jgi:hypothetical protein